MIEPSVTENAKSAENAIQLSENDDSSDRSSSEVEFLSTQPIGDLSKSRHSSAPKSSSSHSLSSTPFVDIEEHEAYHTALSQIARDPNPSSLYSLSQNVRASQLPPTSSATTTRKSRGVTAKKTWAQLEMESQQKMEARMKEAKNEAKKAAEGRKIAKAMKPRKDDVSQLADDFSELGSSQ